MKNIVESIKSQTINEGKYKVVTVGFDLDSSPAGVYVFLNIDKETVEDGVGDWLQLMSITNPKNIIGYSHSDESPDIYNIANNEAEMKRNCLKEIKDHLKSVDDDGWIEGIYPDMGGFYEWPDETYNNEKPEEIYEGILNNIKQSYVDGDSSLTWAVLDINKQKTVVTGEGTYAEFVEDFDEWCDNL